MPKQGGSKDKSGSTEQPVDRKTLIALLNEDLAREYQAIIAYVVYSQVLKGAAYMSIAQELEVHAGEELQHALTIAKQIDYLGGTPAVTPKPVKLSDEARRAPPLRPRERSGHHPELSRPHPPVRGARRIRDVRGHPRDSAAGAGAPDRSGDRARRGSTESLGLAADRGRSSLTQPPAFCPSGLAPLRRAVHFSCHDDTTLDARRLDRRRVGRPHSLLDGHDRLGPASAGGVVPIHYDLTVSTNLTAATFAGEETIRVRLSRPSSTIVLHAAEITFRERADHGGRKDADREGVG